MTPQYEPGQTVIDFSKDTPRLCWVARGTKRFGHLISSDNQLKVAISHYQDELEKNLFDYTNVSKIKPYSDELWAACQDWINRRTQLGIDYEILKRGKQPKQAISKSVVPWQASLLEATA
jgi:hypothetical protein